MGSIDRKHLLPLSSLRNNNNSSIIPDIARPILMRLLIKFRHKQVRTPCLVSHKSNNNSSHCNPNNRSCLNRQFR